MLNANGSLVVGSYNGGNRDEAIRRLFDAGVYYVNVYRYSGNTQYHLALNATANAVPDNAGNSLGAARDLGKASLRRRYGPSRGPETGAKSAHHWPRSSGSTWEPRAIVSVPMACRSIASLYRQRAVPSG